MSHQPRKQAVLKKAQTIRYSPNFILELSRLLGAYAYYLTNRAPVRALYNMNTAIDHVMSDLVPDRIFMTFVNAADAEKKLKDAGMDIERPEIELLLDGEVRKKLFYRYATLFKSLFGTGPSLNNKFSFLDLRPRVRPVPSDDVVFINRHVRLIDVWGSYSYDYLMNKVKFITVQNTHNAAGFPIQVEKPQFSFTDKNIKKKMTNAVPHVYYSQNEQAVMNRLLPVAKILEHLIAFFLHMEGVRIIRARGAPAPGSEGPSNMDEGDVETQGEGYDTLENDEEELDFDNDD